MKRSKNHNEHIKTSKPHFFLRSVKPSIWRAEGIPDKSVRFMQWSNLPTLCKEAKAYFPLALK